MRPRRIRTPGLRSRGLEDPTRPPQFLITIQRTRCWFQFEELMKRKSKRLLHFLSWKWDNEGLSAKLFMKAGRGPPHNMPSRHRMTALYTVQQEFQTSLAQESKAKDIMRSSQKVLPSLQDKNGRCWKCWSEQLRALSIAWRVFAPLSSQVRPHSRFRMCAKSRHFSPVLPSNQASNLRFQTTITFHLLRSEPFHSLKCFELD